LENFIMTDQTGNESHRYDFDESALPVLDKVGSNNSTSVGGTPTFNGNSMSTDGVNDRVSWNAANQMWTTNTDYSGYMAFKYLDTPSADNEQFVGPSPNGLGTVLLWSGTPKELGYDANNTGATRAKAILPRLLTNTETIVVAFSRNNSTREIHIVVKSSGGLNVTATVTETGTAPADLGQVVGANGPLSGFTAVEVFQMGGFTATYSVADLQDTAASVLATVTGESQDPALLLTLFS
jgi:hypothetical protein